MQCALTAVANALRDAGWARCGNKSRLLRKLGVPLLYAPHRYVPWAVLPVVHAPREALQAVAAGRAMPKRAFGRRRPRAYQRALQRVSDEVLLLTIRGRRVAWLNTDVP